MNGARHALFEFGKRVRDRPAACFVVPAIEPNLSALAHILVERTFAEALEPRRPFGVGQSPLERLDGERIAESDAGGGDRCAGIVDLMPPVEAWHRKVAQPRLGLKINLRCCSNTSKSRPNTWSGVPISPARASIT